MELNIYKQLEPYDFISKINGLLDQGNSLSDIEDITGLSRKSIRRRADKINYKYNSNLKKYVPSEEQIINTEINIKPITKNKKATKDKDMLTDQEIKEIRLLLKEYDNIKKQLSNQTLGQIYESMPIAESKIVSIRVNKAILKEFEQYAIRSKYNKKDLVSMALKLIMESE